MMGCRKLAGGALPSDTPPSVRRITRSRSSLPVVPTMLGRLICPVAAMENRRTTRYPPGRGWLSLQNARS